MDPYDLKINLQCGEARRRGKSKYRELIARKWTERLSMATLKGAICAWVRCYRSV